VIDATHDSDLSETLIFKFATTERIFANWSAHRLIIWQQRFPTVEHAYQYKKFEQSNPAWAKRIKQSKSPYEAKRLARQKTIDSKAWNVIREVIMLELIKTKIQQHEDVRFALAATGTQLIAAPGSEQGNFWGSGKDGMGQNVLGRIWMYLRQENTV
jgi:N-glycosidase YbiA